jgi:hypothetical protein
VILSVTAIVLCLMSGATIGYVIGVFCEQQHNADATMHRLADSADVERETRDMYRWLSSRAQ